MNYFIWIYLLFTFAVSCDSVYADCPEVPTDPPVEGIRCDENNGQEKFLYCHYNQGNLSPVTLCLPLPAIENGHNGHEHDHYMTSEEWEVDYCDEV